MKFFSTTALKNILKKLWYSIFQKPPYILLSGLIVKFIPEKYHSGIEARFFDGKPDNFLKKLIKTGINARYYSLSEMEQRSMNRAQFWGSTAGKEWHKRKKILYTDTENYITYVNKRKIFIQQLVDLTGTRPDFSCLCEVGTGNGMFLKILSESLGNIDTFVGIDLNEEQISENIAEYKSSLKFVHAEISDYLRNPGFENLILVSNGTFEYFTENELRELFEQLKTEFKEVAIALREPVNINLEKEFSSQPRGNLAYSHNYPFLLENTGYTIFQLHIEPVNPDIDNYNSLAMIATYGVEKETR